MKFSLDLSSEALFAGTVVSIVLTLIVCATVNSVKPASCYDEMKPGCWVPGTLQTPGGGAYSAECLATVARACSGG